MASKRKLKKAGDSVELSRRELAMAELLEEVLDTVRWLQILGYSNQYLVSQHLKVGREERDRILEAATRAVDKDAKLGEWQQRLAQMKGEVVQIKRVVHRAKRDITRRDPDPVGYGGRGCTGDAFAD